MKKLLSVITLTAILLFLGISAQAQPPTKEQIRQKFEQRLELTNKQKEKAKAIHQKGREQMKPIIMKLELAKSDLEQLKTADTDDKTKEEQISKKQEEIKSLEKQAREIRRQNSQEFENILTKKQKKELELMKAEGRAKFNKKHHPRPPFKNFNSSDFFTPQRLFPPREFSK